MPNIRNVSHRDLGVATLFQAEGVFNGQHCAERTYQVYISHYRWEEDGEEREQYIETDALEVDRAKNPEMHRFRLERDQMSSELAAAMLDAILDSYA